MKISIATVSLSGSLTSKLAAIAAAGFDGIEIFEQDFLAWDFAPAKVGRMVRDRRLEITLYQPFRDFEGLPEPHRSRAFARATALLAQPHRQDAPLGQLAIPAIRGVGGSVIRLLDEGADLADIWQVDFRSAPVPIGAGITGIDHVGQTMADDEMLSWTLFHTSISDGQMAPMVDVVDPDGLVRSQVVQLGGLRVTLNGAEARYTLAGRFIEGSFGASVQHVAFANDDIFATADRLADLGFAPLRIGANFYQDIRACFGLEDDLVARMQRATIMEDEDADGRFFQLCSEPRTDGFFFEIVQRQGGYAGYGAPRFRRGCPKAERARPQLSLQKAS